MAVSQVFFRNTFLLLCMQAASLLNAATVGTGTGLSGYYYANSNLTGTPALTRLDQTIAFNWNGASPGTGIPTTYWGARWVGEIQPQYNESYTLYAKTDDGVRMWIDEHGKLCDLAQLLVGDGLRPRVTLQIGRIF